MEKQVSIFYAGNLSDLCLSVRRYIRMGEYEKCFEVISDAMKRYPHAPHPHNLLGILLEVQGSHFLAMKHFRAAFYLEPAYKPAQLNLKYCGSFFHHKHGFFDETDCRDEKGNGVDTITFDSFGVGHIKTKKKLFGFLRIGS